MKLVVEIDNEHYERIMRLEEDVTVYPTTLALYEAVKNGKPLPKGYGDLVDFDRLCEEYWDGNYMEIHKDDLSNIKPIIEADKEVI